MIPRHAMKSPRALYGQTLPVRYSEVAMLRELTALNGARLHLYETRHHNPEATTHAINILTRLTQEMIDSPLRRYDIRDLLFSITVDGAFLAPLRNAILEVARS